MSDEERRRNREKAADALTEPAFNSPPDKESIVVRAIAGGIFAGTTGAEIGAITAEENKKNGC